MTRKGKKKTKKERKKERKQKVIIQRKVLEKFTVNINRKYIR
jgi:hypothetical protein